MKNRLSLIWVVLCCVCLASCSGDSGDLAGAGSGGGSRQGVKEKPPAPAESPMPTPPAPTQPEPATPTQEQPDAAIKQRMSDAQTIVGLLDRGYAPREWKEELFDFSFEERSQEFLDKAGQEMDDTDFYQAIAEYLAGFHDSHVSFDFPSTLDARLPFSVEEVEGAFLVSRVHEDMPDGAAIAVGDELLSIDGEAPSAIHDRFLLITGKGNPRTEARYATEALTYRAQWKCPEIPSGTSRVAIRSRAEGIEKTLELEWIQSGWPFAEMKGSAVALSAPTAAGQRGWPTNLLEEARQKEIERGPMEDRLGVGKPETFFPLPSSYVERKQGPYPTGIMDIGGQKIGFIRIHTFSTKSKTVNRDDAIRELEEEVAFFEGNTEALIIDQTNNGGGNWCFTLDVASFFFDTPQKETHDQWRVNRDNVVRIEEIALDPEASEADRAIAARIAREIREALKRGDALTRPIPECNLDGFFDPHTTREGVRVVYTKPILMLVNELSVSCGDYFPAFFQDRGRAVLFGAQTSGGGGSVTGIDQRIGYSEFTMRYTISMGVREPTDPDGGGLIRYIENAGVNPDVPYEITAEDIVSGYKPYAAAVERAVLDFFE